MESAKGAQDSLYPLRVALLQRKQQMNERVRKQQIEPRENHAAELSTATGNSVKVLFWGNDDLKQKYLQSTKSVSAGSITTIGVSFESVDNVKGNTLQMWDTAGQSRYVQMTPAYLRGTHILIIFANDQEDFDKYKAQIEKNDTVLNNNILMILVKPGDKKIVFEPLPFSGIIEIDGKFDLRQLATSVFTAIDQYAKSVPGLLERVKAKKQTDNTNAISVLKDFVNDKQYWNKITGNLKKPFPDIVILMQNLFKNNTTPTFDDFKKLAITQMKELEKSEKSTLSFLSSKPHPTTVAFNKCVRDATDFTSISAWISRHKAELSPPSPASTPAPKKQ